MQLSAVSLLCNVTNQIREVYFHLVVWCDSVFTRVVVYGDDDKMIHLAHL